MRMKPSTLLALTLSCAWPAAHVDLAAQPQQLTQTATPDDSAFVLLQGLVTLFTDGAPVANGLNAKLAAAAQAPNENARAGQIEAFINQVTAQIGKTLTEQEAAILIGLAQGLI